jgi:hypothetical protein
MVKKSNNEGILESMKHWFIVIQGIFTIVLFVVGFFAARLIDEFDDLQRQVNKLTVEINVMKREMEVRNWYKSSVNFIGK